MTHRIVLLPEKTKRDRNGEWNSDDRPPKTTPFIEIGAQSSESEESWNRKVYCPKAMMSSSSNGNHNVRIVMPVTVTNPDACMENKISANPSNSKNPSRKVTNSSRKVTSKLLKQPSSSSQEYRNYLEEMELKIRYMKNDIEFKTGQMNSKLKVVACNPTFVRRGDTLLTTQSKLYSCALTSQSSQLLATQSYVPGKQSFISGGRNLFRDVTTKSISHQTCPVIKADHLQSNNTCMHSSAPLYLSSDKRKVIYSSIPGQPHASSPAQKVYRSNIVTSSSSSTSVTSNSATVPIASLTGPRNQSAAICSSKYKLVKAKSMSNITTEASVSLQHPPNVSTPHDIKTLKQPVSGESKPCSTEHVMRVTPGNKQRHQNLKFPKKCCPTQVQAAAKLVSKYKLKRLSPTTSSQTPPRFPTSCIKTVSPRYEPATGTSVSKYKLVKPKDTSSSSSQSPSSLDIPNTFDDAYIKSVKDNQTTTLTGIIQPDSSQRRHNFRFLSKNHPPLKVLTASRLVSKYSMKRLSPTSLAKYFNLSGKKIQHSSPSHNKWQNAFRLDKRKTLRDESDSALKAGGSVLSSQAVHEHAKKYNRLVNEVPKASRYKWMEAQLVKHRGAGGTQSNARNSSSPYKWQWQSASHNAKSRFQWHRANNYTDSLRSQIQKERLKHRLKIMMTTRYSSRNTRKLKDGCNHSPVKWGDGGNKEVGRLVMIGHMLYKASSRKLTRADPGVTLPSELTGRAGDKEEAVTAESHGGVVGISDCRSSLNSRLSHDGTKATTATVSSPSSHSLTIRSKFPGSFVVKNVRPQKMKLVTVRGVRFHLESNGRKLARVNEESSHTQAGVEKIILDVNGNIQQTVRLVKRMGCGHASVNRVDIGGMTYVKTGPGTLELLTDKYRKIAASRAIQRSLSIVSAKHKKGGNKLKKNKQRHCLFFGRFGKCQRGDSCPFAHDPKKVAVCTRFLRGRCNDAASCPFSHDASIHKMPVCLYYLRGLCSRQDCLYLHVKVNPDAPVCKDFLHGYCPQGRQCKKLHSFVCPSYTVCGKCPRGEECSMLHRRNQKNSNESILVERNKNNKRSKTKAVSKGQEDIIASKILSSASTSSSSPMLLSSPLATHSIYLVPTSGSTLAAQPSFISLVSATSGVRNTHQVDTKQSRSNPLVTATMSVTATHGEQQLKITPDFVSSKTINSQATCDSDKTPLEKEGIAANTSVVSLTTMSVFDNINPPPTPLTTSGHHASLLPFNLSDAPSASSVSTLSSSPLSQSLSSSSSLTADCESLASPPHITPTSTACNGGCIPDALSAQINGGNCIKSSPESKSKRNLSEDCLRFETEPTTNNVKPTCTHQPPQVHDDKVESDINRKEADLARNKDANSLPLFRSMIFNGSIIPSFMGSVVTSDSNVSFKSEHQE